MHIPKTCLVLIFAILLTSACSPSAPAKQADSPILTKMGEKVQALPVTSASEAVKPGESDPEFNPESSFPLAPDTQFDPGNGGSEEVESSGAFLLHSQASAETVSQFYQSALSGQGWQLRYIDANHAGGVTQYWKQGLFFMSLDFAYDNSGLAIQAQWHQVNLQHVQLLPKAIPLPGQAEFVDATDSTWQVFIAQQVPAVIEFYRQKAAALNWKPASVKEPPAASCSGDCASQATQTYPPDVTPMPTPTPDPRQPQALAYSMSSGDEISLEFLPHQDATILNLALTLKNVESAGLPGEIQIYPGATDLIIAPGLLRFTVPVDVSTAVQFYSHALSGSGWAPYAGYSVDTPELYFQEWDKGDQALRLNISSPASSSQSSLVSIQCLQCTAP